MEIKLSIKGMMCSGCENRVKSALSNVKGVKAVVADHISGEISVEANDSVKVETLKEKIKILGFDVL